MKTSLPLLIRHVLYNLRGGFLVRPLIIAVTLGLVGGVASSLETASPWLGDWVPSALFPSHLDHQVAQNILGDIAASVMTVVSIVFAILLMTLTLASMQFSPRIIVSFAKDKATQWTLGIFLGTFLYCIAALPGARSFPTFNEPRATLLGAMMLALACVAWLLFFIHHISQAISVSYIVDRIAAETELVIDDVMLHPWRHKPSSVQPMPDPIEGEVPVLNVASGYVRFVDASRLLAVSTRARISIKVLRRVGHFIPAGVPLMMVAKSERLTEEDRGELLAAFDIGPTRTLQQDVEFGVLQIVDIALRAISPAVNDPTTAINCIDQLSRVLIRFIARDLPDSRLYDSAGNFRVYLPWIGYDRLLDAAFEQIRLYANGDLAVSLRLLRAYGDLAVSTPDFDTRMTLLKRAERVLRGCAGKLEEDEMRELKARLNFLQAPLPTG